MKIWHISDTHGQHESLTIPEGIDLVIHSGDASNYRSPYPNEPEMRAFIPWFAKLDIKHKIFVPGNHDTSIEAGLVSRYEFNQEGIIYLENEAAIVENLKIWGSPCTPTFGHGWAWNVDRDKLGEIWSKIPEDTDIIVSHGPPHGYLDLAHRYFYNAKLGGYVDTGEWENCGCQALKERISVLKPKLVCYGHIHNNGAFINAGSLTENGIIYSNGSVLTDSKFGRGLTANGNIFEI